VAEPLTVMHLRASNFVGGPEKQILEHFNRLDQDRFSPMMGTFVSDGVWDPLGHVARARGFRCVSMNSVSPLNPVSIYNLAKVLRRENVSILCTHGYKPNILGCLAAAFTRIPTIAISRGWTWESPKIRFYETLDRMFLRIADHIVAVSAGQREKILACGVRPERVSVIHNAINLAEIAGDHRNTLRRELALPEDCLIVASAGRLSPEKNYSAMIDVALQVSLQHQNVYFIVFGEGGQRAELEKKVIAAGLSGRFFFPGFRKDVQNIFAEIDIFMLPSFTEGLPNVVLEAFAANKPVVATAVGGTPEVVQDGISGFLTTPDDIAGMSEKLLALLDDEDLRNQMGASGYRYVAEYFGFESQTRAYEKLYSSIGQKRRKAWAQSPVGS
jgi:glycosyltransferase involved in cell wall biosynthesis